MNAALAPELLFGFGSEAGPQVEYVELLTELSPAGGEWRPGEPRWLDPARPLV